MQAEAAAPQDTQNNDEIDLISLLGTLIDHRKLIVGITGVCLAGSVAYSLVATPVYKANALIQVEKKSSGLTGLDDLGAALGKESKAVTEIELIKSRTVIGKAVDQLHLDLKVSPQYFPLFGKSVARRFKPENPGQLNSPPTGLGSYAWGGESLEIKEIVLPDTLLGEPMQLVAGDDGAYRLYDDDGEELLQGKAGTPAEGKGIRLTVAEMNARSGTRFKVSQSRRLDTILQYQNDLQISERGKDSGILNLSLDGVDPAEITRVLDEISRQFVRQNVQRNAAEAANSLEFLREQLPGVKADLEKASSLLNAYKMKSKSVDVAAETQNLLKQSVDIEAKLTELRFQQAEMDRKFTRQHPNYKALLQQIEELSRQRGQFASHIRNLPETQQEVLKLTRDVEVGTETYSRMLNKIQELDVVRAGTVGNARIIDGAAVDLRAPVAPKKALIVTLATLLGALLASGFVLARRALNRGVESPEEIEKLGLPVYATVPLSEQQLIIEGELQKRSHGESVPLLSSQHPHDLAVEALRSLRTSLHFAMLEARNNCIMISGPSPGVGKSFVSSNLAAVIAQGGKRVLLVDADLRKGHMHRMFGVSSENDGLSNLLARDSTYEKAVHTTEVPGLSFVPRGRIPPNPSELLMHPNFAAFLERASAEFDLVLVDTPPLLAVTDAAIVGRLTGTALIVTRFGVNPAREIDVTVRRFAQNGIEVKGAIFNGLEKRASAYGRYGYGGYGYYQYEYKSEKPTGN